MFSTRKIEAFSQKIEAMATSPISSWEEISHLLQAVKEGSPAPSWYEKEAFMQLWAEGTAFITFEYGVDGVSVEIAKYGKAIEDALAGQKNARIHLVGGDFSKHSTYLLKPTWERFRIPGINGWDKWAGGKWFRRLFYEDMPEGSEVSKKLAAQIMGDAATIAKELGTYVVENNILVLIPVNIASNPGNPALTLAVALVSEILGLYVINSNHDFYWEGGKPAWEKEPGEGSGPRDHFFRNANNQAFFSLFRALYPWNGERWLQATINRTQSARLVEAGGFLEKQVFVLPTSIGDDFFKDYDREEVRFSRLRMGLIMSGGEAEAQPIPIRDFMAELDDWMNHQKPRVLGAREGLLWDPTADDLIWLLQPTRIVARKQIERDLELMVALLRRGALREAFEKSEGRQLVLHITGPVPIEHQEDLETILKAFAGATDALPVSISDRVLLAFSVGQDKHASFQEKRFDRLTIREIYLLATAVLFPSETEGRGLPIIEASACGKPMICSRYAPEEVFAEVVGEHLPKAQQIQYTEFPEGEFSEAFLAEAADLILHPENYRERFEHNREAVRLRYSRAAVQRKFEEIGEALRLLGR